MMYESSVDYYDISPYHKCSYPNYKCYYERKHSITYGKSIFTEIVSDELFHALNIIMNTIGFQISVKETTLK